MAADASQALRERLQGVLGPSAALPDVIEPGRLYRFSTNGKRGDQSGWCRLFPDCRAGVFGDFRQGVSEVWTAAPRERMTVAELAELRQRIAQDRAQREREQQAAWLKNADRIAFLWRQCVPAAPGTPVYRYLCNRLAMDSVPVPDCLRFHPAMPYVHEGESLGTFPSMVAPVTAPNGRTVALHRTYLTDDGRKADVPTVKKLSGAAGPLAGASIRLATPQRGVIGVAEGLETSLAASCASGVPTVAAYCAGALGGYSWPAGVQSLVIFGDADKAGREAADSLRARALGSGLRVNIMMPTEAGADWCDVWAQREAVAMEGGAA